MRLSRRAKEQRKQCKARIDTLYIGTAAILFLNTDISLITALSAPISRLPLLIIPLLLLVEFVALFAPEPCL
jgi:hypothetical protein